MLATPDSPDKGTKVLDVDSRYATELLLAGKSWEAIEEFTRLDAFTRTSGVNFGSQTRSSLRHFLAIAFLRLGEQENCLTNHTIDSCLMPIRDKGVHQIQRGSRKMGNHIQFTRVPTASTSPNRRSVRRSLLARPPGCAADRVSTSASAKPAARMNDGATRPSTHCNAA